MTLDAIIVADAEKDSYSGTSSLKLNLDGYEANLQTVTNFVENNGKVIKPIYGDGQMSWASAPKLNGIYLQSYLTKQGFNVVGINSFYDQQKEFDQFLLKKPLAVVISTTFITNGLFLVKLVETVRRIAGQTKIIIGGPFVYMSYLICQRSRQAGYLPKEAEKDFLFLSNELAPPADLLVVSAHGERILSKALQQLKTKGDFDDLPNTAVLTNGNWSFSERVSILSNNNYYIDWDGLPDYIFSSGVVPLQASSGCPYNCAFCNFVKDRRSASVKPLDILIREMKQIRNRSVRYVWFVDDNFRLGKSDLENVCHQFIQEEVGLQWMTFIRADTLDKIDPDLLRQAGCIEVQLGIESADHQVLRNMNKHATPELYERVLNKLLSNGINCSCYIIFGFPGETEKSARRTIEFMQRQESAKHSGSLSWSIFPFVLVPLSPVYEKVAQDTYGLSGYMKNWRHETMDAKGAMKYATQAFLGIEHSGLIYRSDNQEMLSSLDPFKRKSFQKIRHSLSKEAFKSGIPNEEILSAFKNIFC